jgi:hypothetical protein
MSEDQASERFGKRLAAVARSIATDVARPQPG